MPAVIVENDISKWSDQTGSLYHFPKRYKSLIEEGTEVLYYKGRLKEKKFLSERLSSKPHYFGKATIGEVYSDNDSRKGDLFAKIEGFAKFEEPVLAKQDGKYLEVIPHSKIKNFWRDAVRPMAIEQFNEILGHAELLPSTSIDGVENGAMELKTWVEGGKTVYLGTKYERDPKLRKQAIEIHGEACNVCGFDFGKAYGEHGKGFIHVHHVTPISAFGGKKQVDPRKDLVTLCANCHAAIHRRHGSMISVEELKKMLNVGWASSAR
jgi:putative restriction endonuclease